MESVTMCFHPGSGVALLVPYAFLDRGTFSDILAVANIHGSRVVETREARFIWHALQQELERLRFRWSVP